MAENGITKDPHKLLTKEILEAAFKADLGLEWNLNDFEIKDFTKMGDNYACAVTGVSCRGTLNGGQQKTYYVAKLNPLRDFPGMNEMMNEVFIREGTFLTEVAVKLNKILKGINYPQIHFPQCIYYSVKRGQEVLLSRDLRQKGFKMFDRRVGMGFDHCTLVIKELAKLHASSFILKNNLRKESVLDLYPFMVDKFSDSDSKSREMFALFLENAFNNALKMIKQCEGYDKQYQWLENLKKKVIDVYCELIGNSPENMRVICHGDCWNNNVLFRYDEEGNPKEVTLLDLQLCRFASLGLDLNYFFFSSLTGDVRKKYYDQLLSIYYEEFKVVMNAANMEIPFTEDEFRKEVRDKTTFGIISGVMIVPLVICESEDVPDLDPSAYENVQDLMEKFSNLNVKLMGKDEIFKSRFLSILDDIIDKGIID